MGRGSKRDFDKMNRERKTRGAMYDYIQRPKSMMNISFSTRRFAKPTEAQMLLIQFLRESIDQWIEENNLELHCYYMPPETSLEAKRRIEYLNSWCNRHRVFSNKNTSMAAYLEWRKARKERGEEE